MPLLDMQHSVHGLVMGSPSVYHLENVTGMGLGPKDEKKYPIAGAAGYRWGREYRRGNLVVFDGSIVTPGDPAAAYHALRELRTAFRASGVLSTPDATVEWRYKMPGQAEASVEGRPQSMEPDLAQLAIGLIPFQATFEARQQVFV